MHNGHSIIESFDNAVSATSPAPRDFAKIARTLLSHLKRTRHFLHGSPSTANFRFVDTREGFLEVPCSPTIYRGDDLFN